MPARAGADLSTNVALAAPRLSASMPTLPVPANRSRKRWPPIRGVRMLNRLSLARSVIGRVADVRGGRRIRPLALPAITLTGPSSPGLQLPAVEAVTGERFHQLGLFVGQVGKQDVGQDVGRFL